MCAGIVSVSPVEIVVGRTLRIVPGDIHIVKTVAELNNIPGMVLARRSRTVICRNTEPLADVLECPCIPCANAPALDQCGICALIHRSSRIISDGLYKSIVHILFPGIIIGKLSCAFLYRGCGRIEHRPGIFQIVGDGVIAEIYLHDLLISGVFHRISGLHVKEFGMISEYGLENILYGIRLYIRAWCKGRNKITRIGIDLFIQRLTV